MADKIRKDEGAEQEQVEKIDLGASLRKEHKDKKPVSRIVILIVLAVLIALGAVLVGQVIRQATAQRIGRGCQHPCAGRERFHHHQG